MIISYSWLKKYIQTEITPTEMSRILTDIGLEVEHFDRSGEIKGGLEGVVVGRVITCEQHPNADRLKLTTVDIGLDQPLQIVCGAPNVAKDEMVMVATIGTTLYPKGEKDGFQIKKSKIRGEESFGMICSEIELGIGDAQEGIVLLCSDAVVGRSAVEQLGIKEDYRIEIGLTPNRSDAASHWGVARDLAVYLKSHGVAYQLALPSVESFSAGSNNSPIKVEVRDVDGVPRYAGLTLTNIEVGPSPEWIQNHLRAIGINPKNNIVDITNFVMHETGQPLHAFDAQKVEGGQIVVRRCEPGTLFTTLDDQEHKLNGEELMICDSTKPLCIAGVFGGTQSGVSDGTSSIFLESAIFNPQQIRRAARSHGLNTDSSFRFERGVDPQMTIYALKRAAMLIMEIAGGVASSPLIDIYPVPIEPFRFDLSLSHMDKLLGQSIDRERVEMILRALEVEIEREGDGVLSVAVPTYRSDVRREADLIEDILRIYGYNNISLPQGVRASLSHAPHPDRERLINIASDMLSANGFMEIMSNSLTKSEYYVGLESFPLANCVAIVNPLSSDLNVMRQSLIFGTLEAMELNSNRKSGDLKLYEFGNTYRYNPSKGDENSLAPYSESLRLVVAMTGDDHQPNWNVKPKALDFFALRGVVEALLRRFGLDIYQLKSSAFADDIFGEALSVELNGGELIKMGLLRRAVTRKFDLKEPVYVAEIEFERVLNATTKQSIVVEELSKYPEVKRDLALLVDHKVSFAELRKVALSTEPDLLKSVSLFDVYQGDKLPEGKKSYALSFILEDKTKTLTDAVIERVISSLIVRFERECGAVVRDK